MHSDQAKDFLKTFFTHPPQLLITFVFSLNCDAAASAQTVEWEECTYHIRL